MVERWNARGVPASALAEPLRRELRDCFAADVGRPGAALNRDLGRWLA
jgi:hypothetical protein